jgi:hypothetical protein
MSDVESTDSRRERFVLSCGGIRLKLDAKDDKYRETHPRPSNDEIEAALAHYHEGGGRAEDVRDPAEVAGAEAEAAGEEGEGEGESSGEAGGDHPLNPATVSLGVKRWISEVFLIVSFDQ